MFWATLYSVKTRVSSSIFPISLAAKTESMSLMSACCCSILSPFVTLELRKNTLNYFAQIPNFIGVASFVRVSGFKFVLILTLSLSWGVSMSMGVASLGARRRHSMTSLSSLAFSVVMMLMLAASMTINLSLHIAIPSHFIMYLLMALCNLATEVGVHSVLMSCTQDWTERSAFPFSPCGMSSCSKLMSSCMTRILPFFPRR